MPDVDPDIFPNYTGMTERDNIFARVQSLAGGRVFRGITPDAQIERYSDGSGRIKPYLNVMFGRPIPSTGDRGFGFDETQQPYLMAITVCAYAADALTAERLAAKVTMALLNFSSNGSSATPLKGAGGFSYTKQDSEDLPATHEEQAYFETTINQSPNS